MDNNTNVSIDNSNSRNDNISMVLLALFISLEDLSKYFTESKAIESTILLLYWNIWCKYQPTLNIHIQFYITNLLQMRKNRFEARIDIKSRAENNLIDSSTAIFENKILHNFIKAKDLLSDLGIFNN